MLRYMLQAKLHRVTVTNANLNYEGSCGLDADLVSAAGLIQNQHIDIYNVSNGERFATYIIEAPAKSGEVSVNGAAARKAQVGDVLIIVAYSIYDDSEIEGHKPRIIQVEGRNRPLPAK
jgi:aspartate 1-decarboxylase